MKPSAPWRSLLRRCLPGRVRHVVGRWYYPRVVGKFREERWPASVAAKALLAPGDRAVDAGANVGYVTRLLSRWVGPGGRVFSFEPIPETFDLLAHNVRTLGLENVRVFPFALGAVDGEGVMEIPSYEDGGENFYEARTVTGQPKGKGRLVRVPARRLDSVLSGEGAGIRLIKIDVEGAELDVVLGASALINAHHPALVVEVSGDPACPGTKAARLLEVLAGYGYEAFVLKGEGLVACSGTEEGSDIFFLTKGQVAGLGSLVRAGAR